VSAQGMGGEETCSGGSCEYITYSFGNPQVECTACCPTGKTPKCNSFGCTCSK